MTDETSDLVWRLRAQHANINNGFSFDDSPPATSDDKEAADEIERLRGVDKLRAHAVNRWVPCSGHRDKTETGTCYVCRVETLRALLRRLLEWDHLDGSADGPMWRREIERVLDRTGVNRESAF